MSSGTAWTIYLDGQDEGALTDNGGANSGDWFADTPSRDNFTLGALKYTSTILYLTGNIGEVWVYSQALSALEISHIYNATKWRYQ